MRCFRGNPLLPLKPTAFSDPCPGMAADVVEEDERSVRGQGGELVPRVLWIGMTRGFWRDEERYLERNYFKFCAKGTDGYVGIRESAERRKQVRNRWFQHRTVGRIAGNPGPPRCVLDIRTEDQFHRVRFHRGCTSGLTHDLGHFPFQRSIAVSIESRQQSGRYRSE